MKSKDRASLFTAGMSPSPPTPSSLLLPLPPPPPTLHSATNKHLLDNNLTDYIKKKKQDSFMPVFMIRSLEYGNWHVVIAVVHILIPEGKRQADG